jgi:hypothetical protein
VDINRRCIVSILTGNHFKTVDMKDRNISLNCVAKPNHLLFLLTSVNPILTLHSRTLRTKDRRSKDNVVLVLN